MTLAVVAIVFLALVWLMGLTLVFLRQTLFILPRARKELIEFNAQRAAVVKQALAVGAPIPMPAADSSTVYPFSGWLQLEADGSVRISGESFHLQQQFEVTATDENNIPRVRAVSKGTGEIMISSHGLLFAARFLANRWEVRTRSTPE